MVGIMDCNLVREIRSPPPGNQIGHAPSRTDSEGRDQDSCSTVCDQLLGDTPRRGLTTVRKIESPGTSHVGQRHVDCLALTFGSEIDDVVNVEFIRADGQRIESVCEAVPHFEEHDLERQREIERRNADGIEAAAFCLGAVTGDR
jgi:hypothetical protein